ncbi:MAG TPA: metalloregulator ArsR/SmtB family transcription factor [Tepidisphaeraceae bacterium]|nr:metalloregulator ArsR/SmtB family transcription factor [Tepidisphaeraceae bacterium]
MEIEQFHRIAKALAEPQRFALLEKIAREPEVACTCLVESSEITQATISHHLKELHEAGLIHARREGKRFFLSVDASTLNSYREQLAQRLSLV